jgi:hypothetical protein
MTDTALTPQQTFEENIKNRLRKDIGDLVPPEVLSALIEKAMKEMFFTREKKPEHSGYNAKMIELPSWFDKEIKSLIEPLIKSHLENWLESNRSDIEAVLLGEITKNGPKLLAGLFVSIISGKASEAGYSMVNDLTNRMRERGLPVLRRCKNCSIAI